MPWGRCRMTLTLLQALFAIGPDFAEILAAEILTQFEENLAMCDSPVHLRVSPWGMPGPALRPDGAVQSSS